MQEPKSKSQVKRELAELTDLAKELVSERVIDLNDLPLDEDIKDAILVGRRCQKSAFKRQLKHISAMLRQVDDELIRETLARLRQPHLLQVETDHRMEDWRERLLNNDDQVYTELMTTFTGFDRQHVHQLVRNAHKEKAAEKPPKYYRQIYQYLKSLEQN